MNKDSIRELIRVIRDQQQLLLELGGARVTAEEMRAQFPTLRDLERTMPGLLDDLIDSSHGDAEATRRLEVIIASAESEISGLH